MDARVVARQGQSVSAKAWNESKLRQKDKQRKKYAMILHLFKGVDSPSGREGASKSGKASDRREKHQGEVQCMSVALRGSGE
jgi:hypothetical protein